MATNCGLKALGRMTDIEQTSMFSLIHLARDNGLNLYFCKVEPEELVLVTRPAIFHQKGHFVYIENGNPMPAGEYSGYVLTPKPLHEPLPYSLAKKVKGSKKGGDILAPIITGVASMINPFLGAAVGAGVGIHRASGGSGFSGDQKGEWWRPVTGGLGGYAMGGTSIQGMGKFSELGGAAQAGLMAGAGEMPGAIKTGDWMSPIKAGLGTYMGSNALQGAGAGLLAGGSGFMNRAGGAVSGALGGLKTGVQGLLGGGGAPGGTTPAGYGGSVTVPGVSNQNISLDIGRKLAGGLATKGFGPSTPGTEGGGMLEKLLGNLPGGGKSGVSWLGTAASSLLPQPKFDTMDQEDFSKASQFLGGDNYKALPTATRQQLQKYTDMSLDDLSKEFVQKDDKGMRQLEERKKKELQALEVSYANQGQNVMNSSDAQRRMADITRQYDQAAAEYEQQIQNQAQQQAVQFKQQILQQSMQQGQFDYESAMELATYMGREQELKWAIESRNQEALQNVLAGLFSMGTQ